MDRSDPWIYAALICACVVLFAYGIADEDLVLSVIAFFTALVATYDVCRH